MQARTLLAITAVLMLLMVCLNFSLAAYVIYLTLPFAVLALLGVGLAIYCGWRMGIWIFIGNGPAVLFRALMPVSKGNTRS